MEVFDKEYLLSFDPGGSQNSWAYCFSRIRKQGGTLCYMPLEAGFVPVTEDIARPDWSPHEQWLKGLKERWPGIFSDIKSGASFNLVAERFVGRGLTGWMAEYITFDLGYWCGVWGKANYGDVRMIMASQWKVPLKRWNEQWWGKTDYDNSVYENWWEDYFAYLLPFPEQERGIVHVQDAAAIGWWYWAWELDIDCYPPGIVDLPPEPVKKRKKNEKK